MVRSVFTGTAKDDFNRIVSERVLKYGPGRKGAPGSGGLQKIPTKTITKRLQAAIHREMKRIGKEENEKREKNPEAYDKLPDLPGMHQCPWALLRSANDRIDDLKEELRAVQYKRIPTCSLCRTKGHKKNTCPRSLRNVPWTPM